MKERNKAGYLKYIEKLQMMAIAHQHLANNINSRVERLQKRLSDLDYYQDTNIGFKRK